MNSKNLNYIFGIIILALVGFGVYFYTKGKPEHVTNNENATTTPQTPVTPTPKIEYKNSQYGFTFGLPLSWKGYSIIEDEWEGYSLQTQSAEGQVITEHGPLIIIRHPDWEYKAPRQDIPIMIFTIKQWNDMQAEKFHIGAAPINPSEIGRNTKYVFAIPARYNFSYLTGYEEVDKILQGKPLKPF